MNELLQLTMDAENMLQRIHAMLERKHTIPTRRKEGQTEYFSCGCGASLNYGDKYCRLCGNEIDWNWR